MKTMLHILTRPEDPALRALLEQQQGRAEFLVRMVDFTLPEPDYAGAIEEIFAAESIAVW